MMIRVTERISRSRARCFLTILLWVMLVSAVVPAVCASFLLMMLNIWMRRGYESKADVFGIVAFFGLPAAGAVGLTWLSIRLWGLAKWRLLSFPIALTLDAMVLAAALILLMAMFSGI